MKRKLIFLSNMFLLIVINDIYADKIACDTSTFLDTIITCVHRNCPEDSIIITHINRKLYSIAHHYGCGKMSVSVAFYENGDTLSTSFRNNNKLVGLHRSFYSAHRPQQFTHYNDSGLKHGWEVFWYDNGKVKDSTFYRNDTFVVATRFYRNGKVAIREKYVLGGGGYSAVTFTPDGKKSGAIKNGTGTIIECDSMGEHCTKTTLKDGKKVYIPPPQEPPEERAFKEMLWERLKRNDVAFVRKLGKKRLNVVFKNGGVTPLHVACDKGTLEMVKTMIKRGARINKQNGFGHTPLAVAVFKRRMDVVQLLLKKGADPNWTEGTYHLRTAIYTAIETRDTAFVGLLLSRGASLDVADYDQTTPLHHAACKGDSLILKMILQRDKEIWRLDDDDMNALDYAYMCKNEQTIKILSRILTPNVKEKGRRTPEAENRE